MKGYTDKSIGWQLFDLVIGGLKFIFVVVAVYVALHFIAKYW